MSETCRGVLRPKRCSAQLGGGASRSLRLGKGGERDFRSPLTSWFFGPRLPQPRGCRFVSDPVVLSESIEASHRKRQQTLAKH